MALAEGYDVSAVLGDLYSSSVEQNPVLVKETSKEILDFGKIAPKTVSTAANTENIIRPPLRKL